MTVASPERAASPERGGGAMGFGEFVALVALTVSFVALSIDAMMPSLPEIAEDLGVAYPNDRQLVISVFVLGLSLSPLAFGLIADAYGRKPAIFLGLAIYGVGCALSALAWSFDAMLLGRLLQGVGAAAPRTLAVTLVRDRFEGRKMARVMSFVMMTFVLVPALAPAMGLAVESVAGWRSVFLALLALGALVIAWMALRLPETLPAHARRPLRWSSARRSILHVLTNRVAMGYAMATGFLFAGFLGWLSAAEQILGEGYGLGDWFALAFGLLSLPIGAASLMNAQLVMRLGSERLCAVALGGALLWSTAFAAAFHWGAVAGLSWFLAWAFPCFFAFGVLFGNVNAMAMRPLGAVAGVGAALVATITSLVAAPIGAAIGRAYDGEPTPIIAGFAVGCALCGAFGLWAATARGALDEDAPIEGGR